jgi:hypothetical protein
MPLFAALLCAAPARAADPELPKPDPPGRGRIMAHENDASTSACIGNPITPLCAAETVIACMARRDDELCRIGMGLEKPAGFYSGPRHPDHYNRYRVLSAKRFTESNLPAPHDLPPSAMPAEWWFPEERQRYRPGDVEIVVLIQDCSRELAKCKPVFSDDRFNFHLRPLGANWAVMIWETPDPRFEKIRPERF